MKDIVEIFLEKNILFKKIYKIDKKAFKIYSYVDIYSGVNIYNYNCFIYVIHKISPVLNSDIDKMLDNFSLIKDGKVYKKKYIIVNSKLCNRAKKRLLEDKWSIYVDV